MQRETWVQKSTKKCIYVLQLFRMHKAHKLTLEKISKLKKSQFLPQEDMWYDKIHESMLRTHQFCQTMKEAAIQRYNNKVLGQLTEISGGRFVSQHVTNEFSQLQRNY
eukprot:TRINITY_DN2067_c0_g1_i4.p1 TRINITY_DN2067_c0_g1~~TRINITY_DN2067_c0_g1_i4.p1  ORF type:complete len:108 (+),score=8.63 TRINITY_DN2067_c0_g1_i4:87-410(+)